MSILLSIDPGETVGVAVIDLEKEFVIGGFILDSVKGLEGIFKAYTPTVVVCEEFNRVHGSSGPHTKTMKLIGAIELLCVQNDAKLVMQANVLKKAYENEASADEMVQAMPGSGRVHVRDALAHAKCYLNRKHMS